MCTFVSSLLYSLWTFCKWWHWHSVHLCYCCYEPVVSMWQVGAGHLITLHWYGCGVLWSTRLSVCLSVREHISGTAGLIGTKFCVRIPCGRGSVLLWRHCASGFMDDVTFSHNGLEAAPCSNEWHGDTGAESDVYEGLFEMQVKCTVLWMRGCAWSSPRRSLATTQAVCSDRFKWSGNPIIQCFLPVLLVAFMQQD